MTYDKLPECCRTCQELDFEMQPKVNGMPTRASKPVWECCLKLWWPTRGRGCKRYKRIQGC